MLKDPPLEVAQLRPRLEPKLLDQPTARRSKRSQRIGLAPGAVQGEHQSREQTLPKRMLAHESLELGHQFRPAADRELRLDAHLQRGQA